MAPKLPNYTLNIFLFNRLTNHLSITNVSIGSNLNTIGNNATVSARARTHTYKSMNEIRDESLKRNLRARICAHFEVFDFIFVLFGSPNNCLLPLCLFNTGYKIMTIKSLLAILSRTAYCRTIFVNRQRQRYLREILYYLCK